MNFIRLHLGKFILTAYRWVGVSILYAVLFGVLAYIIILGFFCFNSTWAAPIIISPSNTQILTLTTTLVTSQESIDTFQLDIERQNTTILETKNQLGQLEELDRQLNLAISGQRKANNKNASALASLESNKRTDNEIGAYAVKVADETAIAIDKELRAGLITKSEASIAELNIAQANTALTDSRVSEIVLSDTVRQKRTQDVIVMQSLTQKAEVDSQIAQFKINLATGQAQINSDIIQINRLKHAQNTAKVTPYYLASVASKGRSFAFVDYSNEAAVKLGAPVYDCYLQIVGCHQVGTVGQVFSDEEHAQHPMFKTDLRGSMILLNLTDEKAGKSKFIFVGGKPLGF